LLAVLLYSFSLNNTTAAKNSGGIVVAQVRRVVGRAGSPVV